MGLQSVCFSEEALDTTVHFHVVLLPRQCFVWLGVGAPKLSSLAAATPTPYDSAPSSTVLVGSAANGEAASLSQRLSMFLKMPVMCSSSLPADSPMLQAFAERKIKEKVAAMCPAKDGEAAA